MDLGQSSSSLLLLLPLLLLSLSLSSSTAQGNLHVFDAWHVPIYLADRPLDPNQTSGEGGKGPRSIPSSMSRTRSTQGNSLLM